MGVASELGGAVGFEASVGDAEAWPIDFEKFEALGAKWLFHADERGVLSVHFLCDGRHGRATELHGLHNSSEIFRTPAGRWCWNVDCEPVELSLAARLDHACQTDSQTINIINKHWPGGCESATTAKPTMANTRCRRERHRVVYGEHFLPSDEASGPSLLNTERADLGRPPLQFAHLPRAPTHRFRAIEEYEGCPSFERFVTRHVYAHRPLVMRGCARDMPLATKWREPAYMRRAAGRWRGHSWLQDGAHRNYTFSEFVSAPGGAYLPWKPLPALLRRDLALPKLFACAPLLASHGFMTEVHMRMTDGHGDHNGLHFDGGDFFSVQVDGTKRWTMVDPLDSLHLYADHVYPPPGPQYGHQVFRRLGVNVSQLPRIVETPALQAELGPSDMLYIPQRWWHEIETLPGRNLALVLQTHFPPPKAISRASTQDMADERMFSYDLLAFALRWRSAPGAASVPHELRPCLSANAEATSQSTRQELDQLWARAVDGAVGLE